MKNLFVGRKFVVMGVMTLTGLLLLLKSFQIQVLNAAASTKGSNITGVQVMTMYPSRGLIYDRDTTLLVNNKAMYDLKVTYNQVKNIDTAKFCELLDIDKATFEKNLNKNFKSIQYARHTPFNFLSKISARQFATFQESMYEFPGFFEELRNVRDYNYPVGGHVLGYISEVGPLKIKESERYYEEGDYIGVTGLESQYEALLRGSKGEKLFLRDNLGRIEGSYQNGAQDDPAQSGTSILTTLDIELQEYGERLLKNKVGSIVAIEPSTGEILTFISSPGYDPSFLSINRNRSTAFDTLKNNKDKPLFNRALKAQYPPGSTFKPLMSLIGLAENKTQPWKGTVCTGAYHYKSLRFGCRSHAEPISNMKKAIQYSCNTYFFELFRDVIDQDGFGDPKEGMKKFEDYLASFGLGESLNIDLEGETDGNVPSVDYYNKIYRGSWSSPTILSLAIGQGELLVTPLQLANLAAIFGNKGTYWPPHLVKGFLNTEIEPAVYEQKTTMITNPAYYDAIIEGMELVTQGAPILDIPYCGKTGTVQNPHGEDHSTFIAFAPKENPKIALAVYVENSGFGSIYARPIASLMIEKYIKGDINRDDPARVWMEKRILNANLLIDNE